MDINQNRYHRFFAENNILQYINYMYISTNLWIYWLFQFIFYVFLSTMTEFPKVFPLVDLVSSLLLAPWKGNLQWEHSLDLAIHPASGGTLWQCSQSDLLTKKMRIISSNNGIHTLQIDRILILFCIIVKLDRFSHGSVSKWGKPWKTQNCYLNEEHDDQPY